MSNLGIPHVMLVIFFIMSISYISCINFEKLPCRPVEFEDLGSHHPCLPVSIALAHLGALPRRSAIQHVRSIVGWFLDSHQCKVIVDWSEACAGRGLGRTRV